MVFTSSGLAVSSSSVTHCGVIHRRIAVAHAAMIHARVGGAHVFHGQRGAWVRLRFAVNPPQASATNPKEENKVKQAVGGA